MKKARKRLGGAVYLLPNMLTTGNLFFGFFSVIKSLQGDYTLAATAILLASIFDILDGRVARLTNATSEFGVQYDSLCDLMSFGLAPAVLLYRFGLHTLGRLGWVVCFLFLACGALRLARFNVRSSIGDGNEDFVGLPIPMAAIVIALYIKVVQEISTYSDDIPRVAIELIQGALSPNFNRYFLFIVGISLALLMVSNIAYRSHKSIKITMFKPFQLLVIAVLIGTVIAFQPELIGFLLVFFYALSGPVEWIFGLKKTVDENDIFEPLKDSRELLEPGDESEG